VPNLAGMNNLSVLRFVGARNVSFDGGNNKGLTFSMPLLSTNVNSRIVSITPVDTASTDITIRNCKLIGNSNTAAPNTSIGLYVGNITTLTGAPIVSVKGGISNINIIGNEISSVRTGIAYFSLINSSNVKIKSNIIGGNIAPGGAANTTFIGGATAQAGIWLKGISSSYIDSNVVRNCVPTAAASNGFFVIYMDEAGGSDFGGVELTRNFVYNLATISGTYCAGIRLNIKAGGAARGIKLYNNFIGSVLGNGAAGANFSNINPAGISIDAQGVQANIGIALAHNTVNLTGNGMGASGCSSSALFLGANIQGGIEIIGGAYSDRGSVASRFFCLG
jgi:hypothetical protein